MWSSLPSTAREFLTDHDVPLHVSHIASQPDIVPPEEVVVTGVAQEEGETLFVRSAKDGREWELPGGRIESDETPTEAMKREFREETGYEVASATPMLAFLWVFPESTIAQLVFVVDLDDTVSEPVDEIADQEWFENIPGDTSFGDLGEETYSVVLNHEDMSEEDESLLDLPFEPPFETPRPSKRSMAVGAVGAVAAGGIVAARFARHTFRDGDGDA